jgi:hypothetical protein
LGKNILEKQKIFDTGEGAKMPGKKKGDSETRTADVFYLKSNTFSTLKSLKDSFVLLANHKLFFLLLTVIFVPGTLYFQYQRRLLPLPSEFILQNSLFVFPVLLGGLPFFCLWVFAAKRFFTSNPPLSSWRFTLNLFLYNVLMSMIIFVQVIGVAALLMGFFVFLLKIMIALGQGRYLEFFSFNFMYFELSVSTIIVCVFALFTFFYLYTRFSLVPPALAEGCGRPLMRSLCLTKGFFWKIFGGGLAISFITVGLNVLLELLMRRLIQINLPWLQMESYLYEMVPYVFLMIWIFLQIFYTISVYKQLSFLKAGGMIPPCAGCALCSKK